ncbi:MAG TPA: endonuclease/exonuclease/phosphatase family protein [Bryobacteraceae bacterium]|nr:endonuclease/exonuclease/phosphatase family protein [Bryobacteraceae bacterium]
MRSAALAVSSAFVIATILPLIRREAWWIRIFDFPRPQITLGLFAAAGALLTTRKRGSATDRTALLLVTASAAYQAWEMSRYTRFGRIQALAAESEDPDRRVRLLIGNVLQTNRNVRQYIELIAACNPDLIVLAETDRYWEHSLRIVERDYPHTIKCPLENTYGLVLYSRLPLIEPKILFRVEEDVPSFDTRVKLRTGDIFQLHVIHPRPPHIGVDTVERDAELILVAKQVKETTLPVIVTGDLNDVAWSHTTRLFLRLSSMLDPRLGRAFCNTFHAHLPLFRWPLDHLFHSRAFRLVNFERGPKTGSDHFPVIVELSYEPHIRHDQERPTAEPEDYAEAQRKLDNVLPAD